MRRWRRLLFTVIIVVAFVHVYAQVPDSLLLSGVETELTFGDSLAVFDLIDRLLQDADLDGSQLARVQQQRNVYWPDAGNRKLWTISWHLLLSQIRILRRRVEILEQRF